MPDDTVLLERHFDTAFAAPDGIQKLRELILTLAMQGKLVPQDPNEESAQLLVQKIKTWKTEMVKNKVFLKSTELASNRGGSEPYELPISWCWTRIGIICGSIVPNRDKPKSFSGGYPWVTLSNFDDKGIKLLSNHSGMGLSEQEVGEYNARIMPKNSVLMSCVGRFGLVAVIDKDVVTNQQIHGFVVPEQLSSEYIAYVIKSQKEFLESSATSTTISYLNKNRCESIPFPLPPLQEQRRIVAKIDRLMARCDELEKLRAERNQKRITIHTATLNRLLNAKESNDFSTAWRFITQHFGELYSVKENVAELRKAILQLAVMGKLVPQDPTDEPASELLRAIAAEKQQLVKEGKIKQPKPLPEIKPDKAPYEVPKGWEWVNLQDLLAVVNDGDHQPPPKAESGIPFLVIGNLNTGRVSFNGCRFVPDDYYQSLDWGRKPDLNDVLYTVTGSYGIPIHVDKNEKFCVQRHVAILKSVKSSPIEYLTHLLKSNYAFNYANSVATGIAQKTVPLSGLRTMPIAIPPINEQRRIVAKIDQLMAHCNELEKQIDAATKKQTTLLNAVMAQV